jgi:4-amino-4-deoxy-L-arabinose transferase-like glycosyltransferase
VLSIVRQLWVAYILVSLLVLLGFTWSLPNTYQDRSFQADENAAVFAVDQIAFPHFNPQIFHWGTALFYQAFLLKALLTAGGLLHSTTLSTLLVGRLVVFASALGAVTALFLLGRKLFDEWTGRLAATILAVLPGFVIGSHYFKTDVPMTFWMLITILAAYHVMETGNSKYVFGLGLLVGYTASVKYSGAVLFAVGCVAIAMARKRFGQPLSWISYVGGVGLGFFFGEPQVVRHLLTILGQIRWVASLNTKGVPYYVTRPPAWIDYPLNVMPYSVTVPFLVFAAMALVWAILKKRRTFLPLFIFLCLYYPLLAADNWRLVRYTVPLLPIAALLVAAFIKEVRTWRIVGFIAVPAISAVIAYAFLFSFSYVQVMAKTDPRIQAAAWMEQHLPKGSPIPASPAWEPNTVQFNAIGFKKLDVNFGISELQKAASPYLIVSEFGTSFYLQAIEHYPRQKQFFQFVKDNYTELAHFENSQKILFINSKSGSKLSQDWLHPNPRITILIRRALNAGQK